MIHPFSERNKQLIPTKKNQHRLHNMNLYKSCTKKDARHKDFRDDLCAEQKKPSGTSLLYYREQTIPQSCRCISAQVQHIHQSYKHQPFNSIYHAKTYIAFSLEKKHLKGAERTDAVDRFDPQQLCQRESSGGAGGS